MQKYIVLNSSKNGWGGPLVIPIDKSKKIVSMTGNGIDPLAKHIGELAEVEVVDGFKEGVKDEDVLLVTINCGGTLRCGVYPQKGIYTINLNAIGPSGPLAKFINEKNYISGVSKDTIYISDTNNVTATSSVNKENEAKSESSQVEKPKKKTVSQANAENDNWFIKFVGKMGIALGKAISLAYESAKDSVNIVLKTILPFMVFISVLVTLILATGIGDGIANLIKPLAGSIVGLLVISIICGIPFLSPLLGPGAAIAQVVGVLLGTQIAAGSIPPQFALPALFAINVQVGADFVPVGLSMQQAEPDTIKYGTPAFLLSRQITGPIGVLIAYLFSFGMY